MKYKKLKDAYDQILPTKCQKERMLTQIVGKKEKRGIFSKRWVQSTLLLTTTCVMLLMVFYPKSGSHPQLGESVPSMLRMTERDKIEYKGECYEYVGTHDGKGLIRTKEEVIGGSVYQIKNQNDSIVVQLEGVYAHYQKCRGE